MITAGRGGDIVLSVAFLSVVAIPAGIIIFVGVPFNILKATGTNKNSCDR